MTLNLPQSACACQKIRLEFLQQKENQENIVYKKNKLIIELYMIKL